MKLYVSADAHYTRVKLFAGPDAAHRTSTGMLTLRTGSEARDFLDRFYTSEIEIDADLGNEKENQCR